MRKIKEKTDYWIKRVIPRILSTIIFYMCYPVLIFIPIKGNKIVVSNFNGKGYGDNPKYICDNLLNQDVSLDIVWLVDREGTPKLNGFPKSIRIISNNSLKALFELHTAKIWIDNCRKNIYPRKRKEQFYIQTWHASFSLKKIERLVEDKLPTKYVKRAKKDSKICDLLIFESATMVPNVAYNFWYEGEMYRKGTPRGDIFINYDDSIISKVYDYYNIDAQKKIIMYAPTFRQGYDLDVDLSFLEKVLQTFEQRFKHSYVMLVRLHPNDTKNKERILTGKLPDNIIDAFDYEDMQELLCAVDTLITDYSSSSGEALFAKKKCFIYAYDYEEYSEDRGLLIDIKELPFPVSMSQEELIDQINQFSQNEYIEKVERFKKKYNVYETGHSSQDIGERILKEMGQTRQLEEN